MLLPSLTYSHNCRRRLALSPCMYTHGGADSNATPIRGRITPMSLAPAESASLDASVERFRLAGDKIRRSMLMRSGETFETTEAISPSPPLTPASDVGAIFRDSWLRRSTAIESAGTPITVADLFSGCGGLSVGAHEAARASGHRAVHVLAVDNNTDALDVFGANFPEAELHSDPIENLVDGALGDSLTPTERKLAERFAGLDIAMGGPPCQGHSDLNNHTRRSDPRNALYLRMARFVEVTRPRFVLIENVPGVAHDKTGVVGAAVDSMAAAGYTVDAGVLTATDFGAAQARRRHVVLASRDSEVVPDVSALRDLFGAPARTVLDAIGDLDVRTNEGAFGTPAQHSPVNEARIQYLFENGLWDLPNEQRPDCHRLKPHSYVSVYGRMHGNKPAPTITSGFGSTGQGRFVHPLEPRTLTPHEAARLQGFPDWFSFAATEKRGALAKMIGNAVPSTLSYAAIASLLR